MELDVLAGDFAFVEDLELAAAGIDDEVHIVAFYRAFGDLLFAVHVGDGAGQFFAVHLEHHCGLKIAVGRGEVAFPLAIDVEGEGGGRKNSQQKQRAGKASFSHSDMDPAYPKFNGECRPLTFDLRRPSTPAAAGCDSGANGRILARSSVYIAQRFYHRQPNEPGGLNLTRNRSRLSRNNTVRSHLRITAKLGEQRSLSTCRVVGSFTPGKRRSRQRSHRDRSTPGRGAPARLPCA